ncbi:hypothetical protein [Streptomyces sp. NPDC017413]|uniref:hypothetical protein n=1 Tax=unclassified Streptomyces TaxID=2593676 RepID=UPI0037AD8C1D
MPKIFTSHSEETYEEIELRARGVAAELRRRGLLSGDRLTSKAATPAPALESTLHVPAVEEPLAAAGVVLAVGT